MASKRERDDDDASDLPPSSTKRARFSPTTTPRHRRRSPPAATMMTTMRSVAVSPTDRENLEKHCGLGVHLAQVNEKLDVLQHDRDWVEACRSDDESSFGDEKMAQLLDWGYDDGGDEDEAREAAKNGLDDDDTEQWTLVVGTPTAASQPRKDTCTFQQPARSDTSHTPPPPLPPEMLRTAMPPRTNVRRWTLDGLRELSRIYR
ncbi:hypothetical protein Slin14017_G128540 [Septoria linicola]|nr:hypothetical protein Slin14017_G128540 [Septoria linicola]